MAEWRLAFVLVAAFALGDVAWAQQSGQPPQPNDPSNDAAAAAPQDQAWFHQQLLDLSEILGGTHYLATLCSGQGIQQWRDAMRSVIQRAPQYSDEMIEAFNRGYGNQQRQFPDCDQSAQQMTTELRARGLRISQGLAVRHTN